MFKCQVPGCNNITQLHQPVNKIIIKTRPRKYINIKKRGTLKDTVTETEGYEIVQEVNACPECYLMITGDQPVKFVQIAPPISEDKPRKIRQRWKKFKKNSKKSHPSTINNTDLNKNQVKSDKLKHQKNH